MARTPPSDLVNAVRRAPINAAAMSRGTAACAKLVAASNQQLERVWVVQQNSEMFVRAPTWPFAMHHVAHSSSSSRKFHDQWQWVCQARNHGLLLGSSFDSLVAVSTCISLNVASVPGAYAALVRHCRARDTSPNWTLRRAASARRRSESALLGEGTRPSFDDDVASRINSPHAPALNKSNLRNNSVLGNL